MRIFLYLLLLLALLFFGSVMFIATQKGDYNIRQTKMIAISKQTIFEYINDYKNWETFNQWKLADNSMVLHYPSKTIGLGARYSWKSTDNNGFIKTIYVKEGDSIGQKMVVNDFNNDIYWTFKDTVGGTKVSWQLSGKVGLVAKVKGFFSGGFKKVIQRNMQQSLTNLEKVLLHEIKTYAIKVNGVTQRKAAFYFKQTISCKRKSLNKNTKILVSRMVYFCKKNNIPTQGKPFVLFERNIPSENIVTFSVCVPTQKAFTVMPGSDIQSGQMEAFTCIKTTLKGDYSHLKEAWQKAEKYVADNQFKLNFSGKYSEVYSITIDDIKLPSHWKTELYIPVYPKTTPKTILPLTTISTPSKLVETNQATSTEAEQKTE